MLPSRTRALKGLTYEAVDAKEYEEQKEEQKKKESEKVHVEMWQMTAGRYTQVSVKYKGETSIVCLKDDALTTNPEVIAKVIEDFYNLVDLPKTAILKKASGGDRIIMSATVVKNEKTVKPPKEKKPHGGYNRSIADAGMTQLAMEFNNAVYKERVIQIFVYAQKRLTDETIPEELRPKFTRVEIEENIFKKVYKTSSAATIRNKATSTLKYMVDQGWLAIVGYGLQRASIYSVVTNPFESEMPAQAEELDRDYIEKSKALQLQMYREQ